MLGYKEKITVDVHDLDFNGVCRASSLMKYIQSAAQSQLTGIGLSYDQLKAQGRAFILSRIKLEFSEPVHAYDALEAFTFPCHSRGYSFLRCYQLTREGRAVCRAASVWALIDTDTKALVKVNDFDLGLVTAEPLDLSVGHFRMPSTMRSVGKYTVVYADLDQNCHVNNTRYADIYANFLPLEGKRIDSMTINYAHEAVYGEQLDVQLAEADGCYYIRTVKPDGVINSEAEIHICDI
jgi:acyl-CoA thioesterase FadM